MANLIEMAKSQADSLLQAAYGRAVAGGPLPQRGVRGRVGGGPARAVRATLLKQAVGAGLAARGIDEDGRPLQPPPDPKN